MCECVENEPCVHHNDKGDLIVDEKEFKEKFDRMVLTDNADDPRFDIEGEPDCEAESCQCCGSDDVEWIRDQTLWQCQDCGCYQ